MTCTAQAGVCQRARECDFGVLMTAQRSAARRNHKLASGLVTVEEAESEPANVDQHDYEVIGAI